MSYKISSIPLFDKQVKRLVKKYPSLKNDLVKLAMASIYDKSEKATITGKELEQIFGLIP